MRAMDTKMHGLVSVDQNTKVKKRLCRVICQNNDHKKDHEQHYANQNYCSDKSSTQGS
jgi:hypothetical protein